MIMLITALLVSGGAGAVLVSEWSDAVRVVQVNERAASDKDQVSVELTGDPAMVGLPDFLALPHNTWAAKYYGFGRGGKTPHIADRARRVGVACSAHTICCGASDQA